jgi:tRNA (cmo5U34)-methyltransferase
MAPRSGSNKRWKERQVARPEEVFSDPTVVSGYADKAARLVPGLRDLHKMAGVLLAERAPVDARVLVLGAGGGLELKVFAEMQANWRFDGVDPSAEMLDLARRTLGPLATRVRFHEGYIDSASVGPFDAAASILTLHFLAEAERLRTLKQVFLRLKSGARLVVAHHSYPDEDSDNDRWLRRGAAFAAASGLPAASSEQSIAMLKARLPILTAEQDVRLLQEAGFSDVELFYSAFTFRGWVACK